MASHGVPWRPDEMGRGQHTHSVPLIKDKGRGELCLFLFRKQKDDEDDMNFQKRNEK